MSKAINASQVNSDDLRMVIRASGTDLVSLDLYWSRLRHIVFYQLEADLLLPVNLLVILNATVAKVEPDGGMQYMYGSVYGSSLCLAYVCLAYAYRLIRLAKIDTAAYKHRLEAVITCVKVIS